LDGDGNSSTRRPLSLQARLRGPKGAQLRVTNEIVAGDTAVVELVSDATALNGMRFDNHYCWVTRFDRGVIVEVRAYLDSAMVTELFHQNPIA